MRGILAAATLLTALPPALALDDSCKPIVTSSEARLAQPAWHAVVESGGEKLESMKVDGQFFMNMGAKWQESPMDLDAAEKMAIQMMNEGSLQVSDCTDAGEDRVEDIDVTVLSYRSAVEGLGSGTVKLSIGKDDGLPYRSVTDDGKTIMSIRYKGVIAPKL